MGNLSDGTPKLRFCHVLATPFWQNPLPELKHGFFTWRLPRKPNQTDYVNHGNLPDDSFAAFKDAGVPDAVVMALVAMKARP
jgi:hypothetical protein